MELENDNKIILDDIDFFQENDINSFTRKSEHSFYENFIENTQRYSYHNYYLFNKKITPSTFSSEPKQLKIEERLDEISLLIKENSVTKKDVSVIHHNIIEEIKKVQSKNVDLLSELLIIKEQNNNLKKLLLKNTTDRRIRSVAAAFLILFSVSLALYYINDYELIKLTWAKLGIFISTGIYFIGFFIGKMLKNIEVQDE